MLAKEYIHYQFMQSAENVQHSPSSKTQITGTMLTRMLLKTGQRLNKLDDDNAK